MLKIVENDNQEKKAGLGLTLDELSGGSTQDADRRA